MGTINNPPLKKFTLRIYAKISGPSISTLNRLVEALKDEYRESIKLHLIPSRGPKGELFVTPVQLVSKTEDHIILVFEDGIFFDYSKYESWDIIFPKIIETFSILAKILGISTIERIALDYIDLFEKFSLKEKEPIPVFFKIKLERPPELNVTFDDFTLGMKSETGNPNHISIMRLRCLPPGNDEYHKIQLESYYTIKETIEIDDIDSLKNNLDTAHSTLIENFWLILTDKTKALIE